MIAGNCDFFRCLLTCWMNAFLSAGSVGTIEAGAAVVSFAGISCVGLLEGEDGELSEDFLLSDSKLRLSRDDMVSLCCEDVFLGGMSRSKACAV